MLYGDKREDLRQTLFDVWGKFNNKQPLTPLEDKILHILQKHPEYHKLFSQKDNYLHKDFQTQMGETNPFMHLGLHLSILEQIQTNQPNGITQLYQDAARRFGDLHEAEHCLMNALALSLHEVFHEKKIFDEKVYLKRIKKAIKKGYW